MKSATTSAPERSNYSPNKQKETKQNNGAHKISNKAHNPEPFNSIVAGKRSLLSAMMKVLADYAVVLHLHSDSRKVITL